MFINCQNWHKLIKIKTYMQGTPSQLLSNEIHRYRIFFCDNIWFETHNDLTVRHIVHKLAMLSLLLALTLHDIGLDWNLFIIIPSSRHIFHNRISFFSRSCRIFLFFFLHRFRLKRLKFNDLAII